MPEGVEASHEAACPICGSAFRRDPRYPRKVTCGEKKCVRAWGARDRKLFRKIATEIPCAVCGSAFMPKSKLNAVCAGEACVKTAQSIRFARMLVHSEPRRARYGVTLEGALAALEQRLAKVHDRAWFEREAPPVARPLKASLADAPVIALTDDGAPIFATSDGEAIGKDCSVCGSPFTGPGDTCPKVECALARKRRRRATRLARESNDVPTSTARARRARKTTPVAVGPPDPWAAPPPPWEGVLPGAMLPIDVSAALPSPERLGPPLHAVLTGLLRHGRGHDPARPEWSLQLVGAATSSGWAVYLPSEDDVAALRGKSYPARIHEHARVLTFGGRACVRLKAPVVTQTARHRVRLTTITPVTIRATGAAGKFASFPSSVQIWTALTNVATRIGLTLADPTAVGVVRVSHDTEPVTCLLNQAKGSFTRGWAGDVVLDVNPLARWLLDVAARVGFGGRTAFGFGRIAVRDEVIDDGAPLPAPVPWEVVVDGVAEKMAARMSVSLDEARAMVAELAERATFDGPRANGLEAWRADDAVLIVQPTTLRALRVIDLAFDEPEGVLVGAGLHIEPHALDRYAERILGCAQLPPEGPGREALRRMVLAPLRAAIEQSRPSGPYRGEMAETISDATLFVGPRTVPGDPRSARLRFIVGTRPGASETSVITVLPIFDSVRRLAA